MSQWAISRQTDIPKPIERVRPDRRYRDLERSSGIPASWSRIAAETIGLAAILACGVFITCIL